MASVTLRGFKGKCHYCGGKATSGKGEHVPGKLFLEKPYPDLFTIPACAECNSGFSKDEEYFLILLAHIGTSETLTSKVEEGGSVDRALMRSEKLEDRIINSLKTDETTGLVYFEPEWHRIHRIIQKIAMGLFMVRYQKPARLSSFQPLGLFPYNILEMRNHSIFIATYTEKFKPKKWSHIQRGVFSYIVVKHYGELLLIMDFHKNAWGVCKIPFVPQTESPKRPSKSRSEALVPHQMSLF